jgi:hypothetical protein
MSNVTVGSVYRENSNGHAYVVNATPKNKTNGSNEQIVVFSWLTTDKNVSVRDIANLVPFSEEVEFSGKTFSREERDFLRNYTLVLTSEQVERLEDGERFESVVPQTANQSAVALNGNGLEIVVNGQRYQLQLVKA